MSRATRTSRHPRNYLPGRSHQGAVINSDQGPSKTRRRNASSTNKITRPSAIDASNGRDKTSDLASMEVDSEESTVHPGSGLKGVLMQAEPSAKPALLQGTGGKEGPGDEGGDGSDEMSEGASDLSEGEDLRDDMASALSGLDFKGNYAISHAFSRGPNPGLTIEGLGLIGLPLSSGDASRIISASRQAPYGHGNTTVVNTDVRNTWEIAPESVSFENPEWQTFLKEDVLRTVQDGLGFSTSTSSLRLQLHKLLLYESGSHFLPHRDTPKVKGMFATVIVVLPSSYTGGEVQVSHLADSKILSLPPNSSFQTSVLAWYADVTHSVKPVRSGYRLALCYNLIHTASRKPAYSIPVTDTKTAIIRRTLRKWYKKKYNEGKNSDCHMLAFLLDHQYSAIELGQGSNALKGKHAHIVANLRSFAEDMGFVLLLSKLKYTIADTEDDYGSTVHSEDFRISGIVDLNGNLVVGEKSSITLSEWQVIPRNAFEDALPDGDGSRDYLGNAEATYEQWYNRVTLILFHKSWEPDFLFLAGGLSHAISKLKEVDPLAPTKADRRLAKIAVANLGDDMPTKWKKMTKIALSWKDFELWEIVFKARITLQPEAEIDTSPYVEALTTFGFQKLRPTLEHILTTSRLSQRFKLIDSILNYASKDKSVSEWCTTQKEQALETVEQIHADDMPLIMKVAQTEGVSSTLSKILPSLHKPEVTSEVWFALLKAIQLTIETGAQSDKWKDFVPQCLDDAISCWMRENAKGKVTPHPPEDEDPRIKPSVELISLILSLEHQHLLPKILDALVSTKGSLPNRLKYLYSPLVPRLREVLTKHDLSITTPPFSNFAQNLIGLYLKNNLGKRTHVVIRGLGCGACDDCRALNAFIRSPDEEYHLQVNQKRRRHVEDQIDYNNGKSLVSYHTDQTAGRNNTLVVKKKPTVITATQWPSRQADARAFLKLFGQEYDIAQLMGSRMEDVTRALDGTQAFQWTGSSISVVNDAAAPLPTNTTAETSTAAITSSSGSRHGMDTTAGKVAGKKRKRR